MAANVTTDLLETELQNLATSLGLSVKEYVEGGFLDLSTYGTDKAGIIARLDALDVVDGVDGINTIAEKVIALNALFDDNGSLATNVLGQITDNASAIAAEQARAEGAESALAGRVTANETAITNINTAAGTLSGTVTSNKAAQDVVNANIEGRVAAEEAKTVLADSDLTVVGSVDYKIEQERLRAVAVESGLTSTVAADIATAKQEAIDAAKIDSDAADAVIASSVAAVATEVDTIEVAVGLNPDGSFTPVDGADSLDEYIADVSGDANDMRKAIRKVARKSRAADHALADDITALAATVAGLGGSGSGSLGDIEARVDVVEDDLNDTTDAGTGLLVKGVKSRLTEAEAAILANEATRVSDAAAAATAANTYTDGKVLQANTMDICVVGNKFRQALGLADVVCNAAPSNGGNGGGNGNGGGGDDDGLDL